MKNRLHSLLLALCLVLSMVACAKAPTWQEQYDLGVRYLSEGNYQEAIIAFTAATKIDPKQADGYIGLAEVYIGMGNTEKAIAVLEQGLEQLGESAQLMDLLQQIEGDSFQIDNFSEWAIDRLISNDEFRLNGEPLCEMTIEDAKQHLSELYSYEGGIPAPNTITTVGNEDGGFFGGPTEDSKFSIEHIGATSWRDISIGETAETVLNKMGFTQAGIAYVMSNPNWYHITIREGMLWCDIDDNDSGAFGITLYYWNDGKEDIAIFSFENGELYSAGYRVG